MERVVCYQCTIDQHHGGALMTIAFCPLHAAAPELLEAAEFVLRTSFCEYKSGGCGEPEGCPWCGLQAAIAKATLA